MATSESVKVSSDVTKAVRHRKARQHPIVRAKRSRALGQPLPPSRRCARNAAIARRWSTTSRRTGRKSRRRTSPVDFELAFDLLLYSLSLELLKYTHHSRPLSLSAIETRPRSSLND